MAVLPRWPSADHGVWRAREIENGRIWTGASGIYPTGIWALRGTDWKRADEVFALFNSPTFEEISISKWLAGNPASLIADNFGIAKDEVGRLPKKALGILK